MNEQSESVLERLKSFFGIEKSTRELSREGEYKHVFCPHCGAFIPMNYSVMSRAPATSETMEFECPNCNRTGAVMKTFEVASEPLFKPKEAKLGRRGIREISFEGDDDDS